MNHACCKSRPIYMVENASQKFEYPKNIYPRPKSCTPADIRAFIQSRLTCGEFTQLRIRYRMKGRGKKWPGFCIADSVYTLEAQGCRAGVQRRKELPVGKHTRPPGLPRKIRRVHGVTQRLLLGSLGPVQELYQGIPA